MKKLILFIALISLSFANKLNIIVSIAPQKTFVKEIGGDRVNITQMVKTGSSPHTYEPKPSQMKQVSKANIYMAIGVEFEKVWLKRFMAQNPNMKVIQTDQGIKKQNISRRNTIYKDPHIWTSPNNIKIIALNILNALVDIDPKNTSYYKINYKKFVLKLKKLDKQIQHILKNSKNAKFMVFHPSWGYFAKEYNLVQVPIEIEGKKPKPKELIKLIQEAQKEHIKAIFVAPEFPRTIATNLANELHIKVISISPLNPDWEKNLLKLSKAIAYNER